MPVPAAKASLPSLRSFVPRQQAARVGSLEAAVSPGAGRWPQPSRTGSLRRATIAGASASLGIEEQKRRLFDLAGDQKGFNLTESGRQEFLDAVEDLAKQNPTENPASVDLTGTEWECLFTTSEGPSSGKIGPFIGKNDQRFPSDKDGQYFNTLALGPLQAHILASYKRAEGDIVRVEFIEQQFSLGPLKKTKVFEQNQMVGTWRMVYQDEGLRIFYTNRGSLFVMSRKNRPSEGMVA